MESNFDGLISLKSLILDHNEIESVTSAAFHHLPRLELLSLANNKLTELAPRIFYKLNTLKSLDLSNNNLLVLDEEMFKDIRNIQEFKCNFCGITAFKIGFSLRFLKKLELAGNVLQSLEDVEAHILRGLNRLDISDNRISEVKHMNGWKLEELLIARNRVKNIEQCAFCQTNLRILDLSDNKLTHLAFVFPEMMNSLTNLSMSGNMIPVDELANTINKFPNLLSLHLSRAGLVSIPLGIFEGNSQLRLVNLSSNYLIDLDKEIISLLPHLSLLDLSYNQFMGLDQVFLSTIDKKPKLDLVLLQGNPWVCDACHIQPLHSWIHSSLMYWGTCFPSASPHCLVCSTPSLFQGRPISSLESLPACVSSSTELSRVSQVNGISQYLAISVLLTVLLIVLVILLSRYRHYGVYHTGEEEDNETNILTNPITVLDKNSESYIDLRYPTLRT